MRPPLQANRTHRQPTTNPAVGSRPGPTRIQAVADRQHLRRCERALPRRRPQTSDPHHLRFAQARGLGQKVSYELRCCFAGRITANCIAPKERNWWSPNSALSRWKPRTACGSWRTQPVHNRCYTIRSCGTWVTTVPPSAWFGAIVKLSAPCCPSGVNSIACISPQGACAPLVPATFSR